MGWGCASGERSAARAGQNFRSILATYYPGTTVRPAGDLVMAHVGIVAVYACCSARVPLSHRIMLSDRMRSIGFSSFARGRRIHQRRRRSIRPRSSCRVGLWRDFPNIARLFRISYWESSSKKSVVQAFVDTLQSNLVNPTATTIRRRTSRCMTLHSPSVRAACSSRRL